MKRSMQHRTATGRTFAMPAATSLLDPLDRDHLACLVGRASELRRALTVIAERIVNRRSEAQIQHMPPYQEPEIGAPFAC